MADLPDFADIPDPASAAIGRPLPPAPPPPSEPAPTRAERRTRLGLGLVLAAAWVVALTLRFGIRGDLDTMALVKIAAWAAAGVVIASLVIPGKRALGPTARVVQAAVIAVPVTFTLVAALMARGEPDAGLAPSALLGCASGALALAFGPVVLAVFALRRALPVNAAWRGAALGALGGLLGSAAIQAHCTVEATAHVMIAHGAPLVLGALLGAAFGSRYGKV